MEGNQIYDGPSFAEADPYQEDTLPESPTSDFDLDREIERQRKLGFQTFDDYIKRTGFPRDDDSYAAFLREPNWMITGRD
jgi:hypothetical protein